MNFRPLTNEDIVPWAELLAASFNRQAVEMMRLLAWFQTSQGLLAWGAWDEDKLVAQYSCLLKTLFVPGIETPLLVGLSTNMTVHPDYRGRGLVKLVSQPVYESLRQMGGVAGVGFSNAAGVKVDKRSRGYGYQVVGRMKPTLVWLTRGDTAVPLRLTDTYSSQTWRDSPRHEDFIHFQADDEKLLFRFASRPFRQYRFGILEDKGEVFGVTVHRPVWVGRFAGVSLLAAYSSDLPELLRRWTAGIRQERARFVHLLTSPRSPLLGAMKTCGISFNIPFTRSPHYLTVKPLLQGALPELFDFSRWDCVGGDIL
jgi:hypothetical protein